MGFLSKRKQEIASQRSDKHADEPIIPNAGIGETKKFTAAAIKVVPQVKQPELPTTEEHGYICMGKNDLGSLMWLKEQIIAAGICSFDYETNGDPNEPKDPQDHKIVGFSVAYKIGFAVYLPVAHDGYAANWDADWIVSNFLKPILEHPDILVMAHNLSFEHQVSTLYGMNMLPKTLNRKMMDTMLMVKAVALPETIGPTGDVVVGLKPSTKALLADENGMVHGLLHVDDIKDFKTTVGKVHWEEPIPGQFYKSGKNKGKQKTAKKSRYRLFSELPVDKKTIDYGASDADWALGLYYKLLPVCEAEGVLEVLFELDVPFMMVLGEIELAGWRINPEQLKILGTEADEALAVIEPQLNEELQRVVAGYAVTDEHGDIAVPAGVYGMGVYKGHDMALEIKNTRPFNWGSNQHLQWLFFHVLKFDLRGNKRSKTTGLPSTGANELDKLIGQYGDSNAFMKLLKEKKKFDKIKSTYVDGMLPFCREDTQKIHTSLNLVSTWRLSSKEPNCQNIPRLDNDPMGIRNIFEAPKYNLDADYSGQNSFTKPVYIVTHRLSGETFYVGADYSQIELKVLAWFAKEKAMIETLANGGDLHSTVAKAVFKLDCSVDEVKELHKPLRYRSKKVNFGR